MSDFREKMVKRLKEDADIIMNKKMKHALDNNNDGTYRNLIQSLDRVSGLIDKYEWTTKWSKYSDEKGNKYISVWEQSSDGVVRNTEIFPVKSDDELKLEEESSMSNFSIFFNNKLKNLRSVQYDLFNLSGHQTYNVYRNEGTTFGCLLSAFHYGLSKPNQNIIINVHRRQSVRYLEETAKQISKEYLLNLDDIDGWDNTSSTIRFINLSNGTRIYMTTDDVPNNMYFDIIYVDPGFSINDEYRKYIEDNFISKKTRHVAYFNVTDEPHTRSLYGNK